MAQGKIGARLMAHQKPTIGQFQGIIVPALIKLLKDKEDWVRSLAAEALGSIGSAGNATGVVLKGIFKRKVMSALTRLLKDEKACVRKEAARALKKTGCR